MLGASRLFRLPAAVPSVGAAARRGIKFASHNYPAAQGYSLYSPDLENAITETITKVGDPTKAFRTSDGKPRLPTDAELQNAAALGALANVKRATLLDRYKMSLEDSQQLTVNNSFIDEYFLNGRRILDKIPVEDPVTGEVTWQVIRENQKEGWENIMYYGYVPGMLIALGFYFFLEKDNLRDWANEELRLRAQERHGPVVAANKQEQDDIIVERILSGEYDRLAGIRKAGSDLPPTLL